MSEFGENLIQTDDVRAFRETQIRLLKEFKRICEKHNLSYWLDFGTLLGAVRDGGFIPWDDDVDVSMPVPDYEKFIKIAEEELPQDIFMQTPLTDPGYNQKFIKLRDCYSTYIEHHDTSMKACHRGIYLDIFPSVVYPKIPYYLRKVLLRLTLRSRYNAFVLHRNITPNKFLYRICSLVWKMLSFLKPYGMAQSPEDNGYNYVVPMSYIYPLGTIDFEGETYSGPNSPHDFLEVIFKNHMTPPPENKRQAHARYIDPHMPCGHPRSILKKS